MTAAEAAPAAGTGPAQPAPPPPASGAGAGQPELVAGPDVPAVDAAMAELATLDELPVHDHAEVYERVHRRLQDAMVDADEE